MDRTATSLFLCLIIIAACLPLSQAVTQVHLVSDYEVHEGSSEEETLEECKDSFVGYDNTFLRGVKEEFFISYNRTSFDDCVRYCCLETQFTCSSFSYFEALRVCYVMNQTMDHESANLANFPGWKHFHKFYPTEQTTDSPDNVTEPYESDVTDADSSSRSSSQSNDNDKSLPDAAMPGRASQTDIDLKPYPEIAKAERLQIKKMRNSENCGCKNGGTCKDVVDDVESSAEVSATCNCLKGYAGEYCEKEETDAQKAGVPGYIIGVAVVGLIIFLLFLVLFIVFVVYRQKTGKYRLKLRREKWRKKKLKEAQRSHSFMSEGEQSPFPNDMFGPGPNDSADTPSSTSSV